jgi:uncharacterized phage protein gp47/JayE
MSNFLPIFSEDIDTVRARLNADANPALLPDDSAFLDTTVGGFWYDLTQASALEIERLWSAVAYDMVAASFPLRAWGIYLDEHGITVGVPRKDAANAGGVVTFTGRGGTLLAAGTQVSSTSLDPAVASILFATTQSATIPGTAPATGSIDVPVRALLAGSAGNLPGGAIAALASPLTNISEVTNADPTTGGADVESDADYRLRILIAYRGARGSGTVADYVEWALAYPGVSHATCVPIYAGPGTVLVLITDVDNRPMPTLVVTELQTVLDPVPEQGRGKAPIGAKVTVSTPTTVNVNIAAVIVHEPGYTLDGTAGSIATRDDIDRMVREYIDKLPPGGDVIRTHVYSRFFFVPGVLDVTTLTLNATTANVAIGSTQVADTGTVTLT